MRVRGRANGRLWSRGANPTLKAEQQPIADAHTPLLCDIRTIVAAAPGGKVGT
jgi:hypothetical protein